MISSNCRLSNANDTLYNAKRSLESSYYNLHRAVEALSTLKQLTEECSLLKAIPDSLRDLKEIMERFF
jgi:hypothetical protein